MTETFGDYGTDDVKVDAPEQYDDSSGNSLFDTLRADSQKDLDNTIHLPANRRGDYNFRFNAVISRAEINRYQRHAQGKSKKAENADAVIANALPVLEKCTGIFHGGTKPDNQVAKDGQDLTLRSSEWLELQGHPTDAIKALQHFLGDAGIITMGGALLEAAGWTEDLEPLDPTDG